MFTQSTRLVSSVAKINTWTILFNYKTDKTRFFHIKLFGTKMSSLNLKRCMNIPDDFEGYSKNLFCIPKHYEDSVGNVLIPAGIIQVSTVRSTYRLRSG